MKLELTLTLPAGKGWRGGTVRDESGDVIGTISTAPDPTPTEALDALVDVMEAAVERLYVEGRDDGAEWDCTLPTDPADLRAYHAADLKVDVAHKLHELVRLWVRQLDRLP